MPQLLFLLLGCPSAPPPPPPNTDTNCCPYLVFHPCSSSFVPLNTILPLTFFLRLPNDFPTLHPIFTNKFVPIPLTTGFTKSIILRAKDLENPGFLPFVFSAVSNAIRPAPSSSFSSSSSSSIRRNPAIISSFTNALYSSFVRTLFLSYSSSSSSSMKSFVDCAGRRAFVGASLELLNRVGCHPSLLPTVLKYPAENPPVNAP